MATKTFNVKQIQRKDTAANWTSTNPVLSTGEIGFESDTGKFKIGDGTTAWTSLIYAVPVTSVNGQTGDVTVAAGGAVTSVNNKTGAVTLTKTDVGLGSVNNTADANKSVYDSARLGGSLPSAFVLKQGDAMSGRLNANGGINTDAIYAQDGLLVYDKNSNSQSISYGYGTGLQNYSTSIYGSGIILNPQNGGRTHCYGDASGQIHLRANDGGESSIYYYANGSPRNAVGYGTAGTDTFNIYDFRYGNLVEVGANWWVIKSGNTAPVGGQSINGYSVFCPFTDGNAQLGAGSLRWRTVNAQNGTIQTSDRREKKEIEYGIEKYEALFDKLKPVTYKFIKNDEDRKHLGFIAQDVYDAAVEAGLTKEDLAMLQKEQKYDGEKHEPIEGEYIYSLGYGEFAALNVHMIHKLQKENIELKERLSLLEEKVALLLEKEEK